MLPRTAQGMSTAARGQPARCAPGSADRGMSLILHGRGLVCRLREPPRGPQRPTRRKFMTRRAVLIVFATMIAFGFGATAVRSQGAGKVAMLLPGSINDQSWNAAGLRRAAQAEGQGIRDRILRERPGGRSGRGHEGLRAAWLQPGHRPLRALPVGGAARRTGLRQDHLPRRLRLGRAGTTSSRSTSPTRSSATWSACSPRA